MEQHKNISENDKKSLTAQKENIRLQTELRSKVEQTDSLQKEKK